MGTIFLPDHPIMKDVKSIIFRAAVADRRMAPRSTAGRSFSIGKAAAPYGGAFVTTMPNGVNRVDLQMNPWSEHSGASAGTTGRAIPATGIS